MNKKGITLTTLIITASIMIILLGVVSVNIKYISDETNAMKFLNDISMVETKVMVEQYNAGSQVDYSFVGTQLTTDNPMTIGGITFPKSEGLWYILNTNDLEKLGLSDITGQYVVDYSTGVVYCVEGVKVNGVKYYNFDDVARVIDFK